MEECAERQEQHVLLRVVAEHAEHGGEHGDVDAVCERVGVVQADIRELDEVAALREDVGKDVFRYGLHACDVDAPRFLNALIRLVDALDCRDARALLYDVFRWRKFQIGIH